MGRRAHSIAAVLVPFAALASLAVTNAASFSPDDPSVVEIRTNNALVNTGGWFGIEVYCGAPEGSVCSGSISVARFGIRPGAAYTVPLAIRHSYNLAGESERLLAIRLRAKSDKEVRGRQLRANATVFVRYGSAARKAITLTGTRTRP